MREEDFTSAGGVRIHMRSWDAEGTPRAVVVICHGLNSHSGQYAWTAEQFASRGLAVFAVDLRGRGKSEGERFYVEDVADYVADVRGLIRIAKERTLACRSTCSATAPVASSPAPMRSTTRTRSTG